MEDFKKVDEYNNLQAKKPEENIKNYSFSFHSKIPDFSNKNHQTKNNPLNSDMEFYANIMESQRVSCLNREALRSHLNTEVEDQDEENNEYQYFDKNTFKAKIKKSIFGEDLKQIHSIPSKRNC
jgi:hypothetical protein